jgi:pimeloyl-ACP methyl ester carboxylesterase
MERPNRRNASGILDRVQDIEVPTLAICGREDIMTPPKYTHYMVEKMPDARAVIIPEGSHLVYVEKPEEVNQAISEFLQEL